MTDGAVKILVIYDDYIPLEHFRKAFANLANHHEVKFARLDNSGYPPPSPDSVKAIREYYGNPNEVAALVSDEDALVVHVAPVTQEVLRASPRLKAVFCARGGPVNIDVAEASRLGIAVVSSPGRNADAVADFTLALMLMLSRRIQGAYKLLHGGELSRESYNELTGNELGGKVLGLIGYGNVGSRVAARAIAFGMSVLVFDPFVDRARIEANMVSVTTLEDLLARSDFVSMHARESSENVDMMGRDRFKLMKRSAYFINTARGSLVDEEALLEALRSKQIAGAALDVMKKEPIDFSSPLLRLDNVVVTPHIAGASHEVKLRGADIAAKQVEKWVAGERIDGVLNPQVLKA